jgi:hypothetical protein
MIENLLIQHFLPNIVKENFPNYETITFPIFSAFGFE